MKILLIYATNSGSTGAAAALVASVLKEKAHSVTLKQAFETTPQELSNHGFFIFGSPSWDYDGKEGQPHEDITAFLQKIKDQDLSGKLYAVLGLGDTSYTHYCGAVDIIETALTALGAKPLVPPLKLDRYYTQPGGQQKVREWSQKLAERLIGQSFVSPT